MRIRPSTVPPLPAGDFDYESHAGAYAAKRRADPSIAARLRARFGSAESVINVGAGTGSYEPTDRYVVAVEPSASMRSRRPTHLPPAIRANADQLPFDEKSFDVAMAAMTVHQWADPRQGLLELRRVSRGPVVVLTFDPDALDRFWLTDYFPELIARERERFPGISTVCASLGGVCEVEGIAVPNDCLDGFAEAYYGRPEAFLDPDVRSAQSAWGFIDDAATERGMDRLRADLQTEAWDQRYGSHRDEPEFEGALRLIVARPH